MGKIADLEKYVIELEQRIVDTKKFIREKPDRYSYSCQRLKSRMETFEDIRDDLKAILDMEDD